MSFTYTYEEKECCNPVVIEDLVNQHVLEQEQYKAVVEVKCDVCEGVWVRNKEHAHDRTAPLWAKKRRSFIPNRD